MPSQDKEKQKLWAKTYYEKNKAACIERVAKVKKAARKKWDDYKATLSCTQCGENHPATLDFHHVKREKTNRKVHKLVANGALAAAYEEIKKCVVLCSNCHRKHHWEEHQQRKKKSAKKSTAVV
jgi:hypothetical protein